MWLFGLSIFSSAFLLFVVQPLIARYVLPWFGGGPGVWTVCLLFFQTMLLGGYAYAHLLTTRCRPHAQAIVHGALLLLSLAFLPIAPDAGWAVASAEEPTWRIFGLLAATLGVPYLALSATGPLLQRWLTLSRREATPYRLYALSNAGSLLGLIAYPFVIDPLWSRAVQVRTWSAGMVVFAVLCGVCAWRYVRTALPEESAPLTGAKRTAPTELGERLSWVAFPAVATAMLAAVTNRLTLDVAPIPFLWVLPLGIYLLTLVLCFDHPRWYARRWFGVLLAVAGGTLAALLYFETTVPMKVQLVAYPAVLFVVGMVCHGEVYRRRPPPEQLTRFYLALAAGGAVGTFLVAVVAPAIFANYHELPLALGAAVFVYLASSGLQRGRQLKALMAGAGVAAALVVASAHDRGDIVVAERNFHGVLRVVEHAKNDSAQRRLELRHGATAHGAQLLGAERSRWPTLYYGGNSGVGVALEMFRTAPGRSIGMVGLGAGTLLAYGREGDRFTAYEINPAVIRIAEAPFTFLAESRAAVEVVSGDARLVLQAEAAAGRLRGFDVLVLDAFSSDSIPVHLLTKEAVGIYLQHLKPDGIIAVHLSNRYLDLRGVTVGWARHFGMDFLIVEDAPRLEQPWLVPSRWCLLTRDRRLFREWLPPSAAGRKALEDRYRPVFWTDDQASVLQVWR